jgi:hypothetical protein
MYDLYRRLQKPIILASGRARSPAQQKWSGGSTVLPSATSRRFETSIFLPSFSLFQLWCVVQKVVLKLTTVAKAFLGEAMIFKQRSFEVHCHAVKIQANESSKDRRWIVRRTHKQESNIIQRVLQDSRVS